MTKNTSTAIDIPQNATFASRSTEDEEEATEAIPLVTSFRIDACNKSTKKAQFIQDFLFTDIMNHVEFLKYIQTLEKDDDLLLVHLLERLRLDVNAESKSAGQKEVPIAPFYSNHKPLPRNALHIAMAYTSIKNLDGHQHNIYEQSYLTTRMSDAVASVLALISQVGFLSILIWQYYGTSILSSTASAEYISLVSVALISSMVFFKKGQQHWNACNDFNGVFSEMGDRQKLWLLHINALVNKYICVVVFVLNIWFVISSDNCVEAILNSVALFFILEIDDELAKDWSNEKTEDEMAINVHDFIMEDLDPEQLHVKREGVTATQCEEDGKEPLLDDQIKFYSGREKLYISFDHEDESISVYEACPSSRTYLTTTYNRTKYTLHGPSASFFFKTAKDFKCRLNYEDIHD